MHRKGGARVVVDDMYDWVHVDERWFYVMKDGRRMYLHPEEDSPKPPRAQNKRFITKVMFLAAVARPRMISDGVWFDRKIGIWPSDTLAAMRSSKNRKKGTMMRKPATINAERYKELMIDKVIPAIKARMPGLPTRSHDLRAAGWCKAAHGGGGHGGNSGKGRGQHHPGNPVCQLT
ncbi:unnamed protein product [Discosporangium mesarthrocarpum]